MIVPSIGKVAIVAVSNVLFIWCTLANAGVVNLRCEYLQNPLGIDVLKPRLSWELESTTRGETQKSVQIIVASSKANIDANNGDLWNTTINGSTSFQVEYNGTALQSEMECWWKVKVTGARNSYDWSAPAMWSMGLLAAADWGGAKWIGDDAPTLATPSPLLRKTLTLSKAIKRAMVYVTSQGAYEVQLNGKKVGDQILAPGWTDYRKRILYQVYDVTTVLNAANENVFGMILGDGWYNAQMFSWPSRAANGSNGRKLLFKLVVEHTDNTKTTLVSDESWKMYRDGFIRFSDIYDGETVDARKLYQAAGLSLSIIDNTDPAFAYTGWTNINSGNLDPSKWYGGTARASLTADETCEYTNSNCSQIKYYATKGPDRGQADVYIDNVFKQTIDQYNVTLIGTTLLYDSGTLPMGPHTIKIVVKHQKAASATDYWVECDKVEVMEQQASIDIRDWNKPGFSDAGWIAPKVYVASGAAIVAQRLEPIRAILELSPKTVTQPSSNVYIFDMGQNMVGWCRLKIKGVAGQVLTLRHGEMLNPDGSFYVGNLRGAGQIDVFTLNGVDSIYEPRFTYHGFRYVEVSGMTSTPASGFIKGIVFNSAMPEVGTFTCSNAMLNQLWSNILWTQRGNHVSVPTDCPQRDERMGWMGDAQIFSQNAIFNMGMGAFYSKFVQDIRDAQNPDGGYRDFAPIASTGWANVPAWADAGVIIPWQVYQNYNDRRLLEEHFASAKKWVDLVNTSNPNHLWQSNRGNDYNDWLDGNAISVSGYPTGGSVPKEVFATAYFYNSALLVSKMATILGQTADAATYGTLANNIRNAFLSAYVNASTGVISGNSQAGCALALNFNMLPEDLRAKVAQNMNNLIVNTYDTRISTGIQTTIRLMMELSRWGYNETAYKLIESKRFPSLGYSIDQGATTIWERWDGWVAGRGFQDAGMNSFNHYALGAVGEWMYRVMLGINPDEAHPGYTQFLIKPQPGGTLTSAQGTYKSISGEIKSKWSLAQNGVFSLEVTVPANTTAEVSIPKRNYAGNWIARENGTICWENNAFVNGVDGITAGQADSGFITFSVGGGSYSFQAGSSNLVGIATARGRTLEISKAVYNQSSNRIELQYAIRSKAGERVMVRLYNLAGACVAELANTVKKEGNYRLSWSPNGAKSGPIGSGACVIKVQAGSTTFVKSIVIIR